MAFVLVMLYVGLLFFRPMEWVPGMIGWPILDYVAAATILATIVELPRAQWRFKRSPQNWLVLLFFIACLMSHVRHTYLEAFIDTFEKFGKIVLLYFLISINVNTIRRLNSLITMMTVGCLFMAIHGILQYHTGTGFGGQLPLYVAYRDETRVIAYGFFNDPNDLALMLVTIMPFVISAIHRHRVFIFRRTLNLVFLGAMTYCIFRTNSRGGWLAFGAMLAAYFCITFAKKKLGIVVGTLAIIMIFIVAPARMQTASTQESSARSRLVAWADGNRMLKANPIFGVGKERFTEHSEGAMVAHNSFVHCYAELGLFGYFFWLGLLMASLKDAWSIGKTKSLDPGQQELSRLARVSISALLGYMAAAFFLSRTYIPPLYILFAVFAAIRSIQDRDFGPIEGKFVKKDLRLVAAAVPISIIGLYILIRVAF